MAAHYGLAPSNRVLQVVFNLKTTEYTALQSGSSPLNNRRHVRIQVQGEAGAAVALAYANGVTTNDSRGVSSTAFTTPTVSVSNVTFVPGATTWIEPLGDKVTIYGRLLQKKGFTENAVKVVVTEYA